MAGSVAMGAKVGGVVEFGLGHNASEKYSSSRDGQERRRKRKKKERLTGLLGCGIHKFILPPPPPCPKSQLSN